MHLDKRARIFVVLAALFCTALVMADIIAVKLFMVRLGSFAAPASMGLIAFPVTFVVTDVLNEFYGKKTARFVTWLGLAMAGFAFTLIHVALAVEWAPFTRAPDYRGTVEASFNNVFGGSQRVLIASMIAYLIGQLCDIALFHLLKRVTHNRLLWLRATGSTVASQLIDTVLFQCIAWFQVLPTQALIGLIVSTYVVKLLVAVGLTPIIYAAHALLERLLKVKPVLLGDDGEPVA